MENLGKLTIKIPGRRIDIKSLITSAVGTMGEASLIHIPIFSFAKASMSLKYEKGLLYYLFFIPLIDSIYNKLEKKDDLLRYDSDLWKEILDKFDKLVKNKEINQIDMNKINSKELMSVDFMKKLFEIFDFDKEFYKKCFYDDFKRVEYEELNKTYKSDKNIEISEENNKLLKDIKNKISPNKPIKSFTTPPTRNSENFVGREKNIEEIYQLLIDNNNILLLNGIGGVGKTELAKKIYLDSCENYDFYGWFNYQDNIESTFVYQIRNSNLNIDKTEKFEEKLNKTLEFLNSLDKRSLLVIDNISDINDKELRIINSLQCKVLTTSREKIEGFKKYHLGFLTTDEAKELFYKLYEGEKAPIIDEIIKLSGNHTLTVELLAKVSNNMAIPLNEFYEILIKKGFTLDGVKEKVEHIKDDKTINDYFFKHLLVLFDLSNLTEEELHILINLSVLPAETKINYIKELLNLQSNNSINSLIKKGWLIKKEFNIFMHNVIQEVVRKKNFSRLEKDCIGLIKNLFEKLKFNGETGIIINTSYKKAINYIYYSEKIIKNLSNISSIKYEITFLLDRVGTFYKTSGNFKKSLIYFKIFNKLAQDLLNLENNNQKFKIALISSFERVAHLYRILNNFNESLYFFKKILSLTENIYKLNIQEVIILGTTYRNIGEIYQKQNKKEKALEFYKKCYDFMQKNYIPHKEILRVLIISYQSMGDIYLEFKEFNKTLEFYKINYELSDFFYNCTEDIDNLYMFFLASERLGNIYFKLEEFKKSLYFFNKNNKIISKLYNDNPYNVEFKNSLAISYWKLGDYYRNQNNKEYSCSYFNKAKSLWEELTKDSPQSHEFKKNLDNVKDILKQLGY